ncbi:MAG TPA: NIPSNAP family protein, partial [Burkholderiaceae bacterium]
MSTTEVAAALSVLELRQYTLHPGRRDELITLFEREFVESQEDAGMRILGTFHDLDDPDRFVWIRGFPDMASRAESLAAFYGGPAWKAHRDAANATMVDSDNVFLLRPLGCDQGLQAALQRR